jgi:hypothetical protein
MDFRDGRLAADAYGKGALLGRSASVLLGERVLANVAVQSQ